MRQIKVTMFIGFIFFSSYSQADLLIRSKDSLGAGYTDNASLTAASPASDAFFKFNTTNTLVTDQPTFLGQFSYTKYATQKVNDLLSWNLAASIDLSEDDDASWDTYGSFIGQNFVNGQPQTTESGFSYLGFEIGADRLRKFSQNFDWNLNPGYRLQNYSNFSGRVDHTLFLSSDLTYKTEKNLVLKGSGSFALVESSLPDYSRFYLDLGATALYNLNKRWQFGLDLSLRETAFTSRSVSTTTAVTKGRGSGGVTGQTNETLGYVHGEASVGYLFSEIWVGKVAFMSSHQTSLSQTQDYAENEIFVSLTTTL